MVFLNHHTSSSSENIIISVLLPLVSSADFLVLLAVSVFPVIISEEKEMHLYKLLFFLQNKLLILHSSHNKVGT